MATLNDVLLGKQITYTQNHPEGRSGSQYALQQLSIHSAARRQALQTSAPYHLKASHNILITVYLNK